MTILDLVSTISFMLTLFPRAWTSITVWSNNVTVQANQSTFLNCSTTSDAGVKWFRGRATVCAGLECFDPYNQRFRVENITSSRSWNLIISSVKAEDAGEYICEEIGFSSDKGSVQLTVSEDKEATDGKSTIDLPHVTTVSDTAASTTADVTNYAAIIVPILGILVLIIIISVCVVRKYRRRAQSRNIETTGYQQQMSVRENANELQQLITTPSTSNEQQHLMSVPTMSNEQQQPMGNDVYIDQPTLVKTIKTKSAAERNSYVRAAAVLSQEVFLATDHCSEIEVYDLVNLDLNHLLTIDQLINPLDIKPCVLNSCLYIFDCEYVGQPGKMLKIDRVGNILANWSMEDSGARLSVASNGNIIVSFCTNDKIVEYTSDGIQVREIEVPGLCHAILFENTREFLISQGYLDKSALHRVFQLLLEDGVTNAEVGTCGATIINPFGGEKGTSVGQLNVPWYMAVDENGWILVAERENQRVTLFSPNLEFKKILISEADGLRRPLNMFMDVQSGRLFVTDFVWEGTKRVDGKLLVFKIRNPTNPE